MKENVLIIDDEEDISNLVKEILNENGYSTKTAKSSNEVFEALNEVIPEAIILDIWLQGSELDGLGILEIIVSKYPYIPVIMISGHGTIETAVNSIKIGAYDYLEKPFSEEKLLILVKRACQTAKLVRENSFLKSEICQDEELVGNSSTIIKLRNTIDKIAKSSSRVLISGGSGTGKKFIAKLIHSKSARENEPFVIFDAAGKTPEEIDKEIFGTDFKFGDNSSRKIGLFELANNGTLLIIEVNNLSLETQSKILRVIQESKIKLRRTNKIVDLNVRIISSSSKNLQEEIKLGKFREDLFYRLNVIPLNIPPLAERRQDIPILCKYFLDKYSKERNITVGEFSEQALTAMQAYNWPGNIRQLKNTIEWILIMHKSDQKIIITPSMLPSEILSTENNIADAKNDNSLLYIPLRQAREIFEKDYLLVQLNRFNNNISKMAKAIGMERSALHRKLKSLQIMHND